MNKFQNKIIKHVKMQIKDQVVWINLQNQCKIKIEVNQLKKII